MSELYPLLKHSPLLIALTERRNADCEIQIMQPGTMITHWETVRYVSYIFRAPETCLCRIRSKDLPFGSFDGLEGGVLTPNTHRQP